MTCFGWTVIRTMLTWGTFSTQVPFVDVMYFWLWLYVCVKKVGCKIFLSNANKLEIKLGRWSKPC